MTNSKGRSAASHTGGGGGFADGTRRLQAAPAQTVLSLSPLLGMVPASYQKAPPPEERPKKAGGLWQDALAAGAAFAARPEPPAEHPRGPEPPFPGHSAAYDDYANYSYCDAEASETTAMLPAEEAPGGGAEAALVEAAAPRLPRESSGVMALQILVPFLLAGFGTVSAGMVLDVVQVGAACGPLRRLGCCKCFM